MAHVSVREGRPWSAYVYLFSAMAIVGSSIAVGKAVAEVFPVFLASALRYGIGACVLVPILLYREGVPRGLTRRDIAVLVVEAACGTLIFSAFLLYGLRLTTAAEGSVVSGIMPALVGLYSVLLLKERMTTRRVGAIALAVCGLVAINAGGGAGVARGSRPLLGDLLVLGALSGEALFVILGKTLRVPRSPLFISTAMSVLGFLMFLPVAAYEARGFDFAAPSAGDWWVIAYYGVAITALAFLLWFGGVARVPGTTASVFTAVMPVAALLCSYAWLGESFRAGHAVGLAAVLGAIVLASRDGGAEGHETPSSSPLSAMARAALFRRYR